MIFSLLFSLLLSSSSPAAIRAVGTTPETAWLLRRIGGELLEVKALARPGDNYHYLDARPDFILAVNRAEIVCRIGLEMEIGWLPKILDKAANTKVMDGGKGDCDLSRAVNVEEKPAKAVDRSMGDAHASGNPHFWFSPLEMAKAGEEVAAKLAAISPDNAAEFAANQKKLAEELKALHQRLLPKLKGAGPALQYHRDFSYFFSAYQIPNLGSIEEIPGVSPSAARLGQVALEAKKKNAAFALAVEKDPAATLAKFTELSGVKVIQVPGSLGDFQDPSAYEKWQESIAGKLKP